MAVTLGYFQSGSVAAMHESDRLSALIGDIYDAALDPNLWINVLGRAEAFVGCTSAALGWKGVTAKDGDVYYESKSVDRYYRQLYFEKYVKLDPCTIGQFFADVGRPVITADLIPYEEFLKTRFYKEWAKPQGLVDCAMTVLDKSMTAMSFLALLRHRQKGFFDDDALRRIRFLVPHFRRAVLIGKIVDNKKAEAASLADTLDGVAAGMYLVDATGRIVHANTAGHVMLNAADVLRAEAGRLAVNDRQAEQTLADAFATAGKGDAAVGIKGVAVPLVARDGERYVAHVLPLTSGARRRAGTGYAAVAALFVQKAALNMPSPPEVVAKTYKLSPMELRVLLAVVEVGGIPEVAEALGIAETTVKTHLHRTYQKTGVNRQADLVKLLAAFSNPLLK